MWPYLIPACLRFHVTNLIFSTSRDPTFVSKIYHVTSQQQVVVALVDSWPSCVCRSTSALTLFPSRFAASPLCMCSLNSTVESYSSTSECSFADFTLKFFFSPVPRGQVSEVNPGDIWSLVSVCSGSLWSSRFSLKKESSSLQEKYLWASSSWSACLKDFYTESNLPKHFWKAATNPPTYAAIKVVSLYPDRTSLLAVITSWYKWCTLCFIQEDCVGVCYSQTEFPLFMVKSKKLLTRKRRRSFPNMNLRLLL